MPLACPAPITFHSQMDATPTRAEFLDSLNPHAFGRFRKTNRSHMRGASTRNEMNSYWQPGTSNRSVPNKRSLRDDKQWFHGFDTHRNRYTTSIITTTEPDFRRSRMSSRREARAKTEFEFDVSSVPLAHNNIKEVRMLEHLDLLQRIARVPALQSHVNACATDLVEAKLAETDRWRLNHKRSMAPCRDKTRPHFGTWTI